MPTTEHVTANEGKTAAPVRLALWSVLCLTVFAGCTRGQYHRAADREVYGIIERAEQKIFGTSSAFNIDTAHSGLDPEAILPPELIEDRLQTGQRVLTVEGALDLAVHNSRRYQTEKENLYLTALTLTGERYEFSPQFFAGTFVGLNRAGDWDLSAPVNTRVGLSQFFRSGGRLSVALANDILRYYTGDPRRSVVSIASVNLVQPLLRGFGPNNPAVESLRQAERNVIYAVRDFAFFQDDFAIEIVSDYFSLLEQKDVIRNRYTNYLSRVQSTRRLEARAVDREKPSDVGQTRQAELSAKNNYVNATAAYRTALDQFKIKLGLPVGEKVLLDDGALRELARTGLVPAPLDPEYAYRLAIENQLQILNAIDQFEDSKRKIKVAADRLRADINFLADATIESERPTDYLNFNADQLRAGVGLELDLPIDRLPERNNYRATLVLFERELRELTLALDTLRDNIERGLRVLRQRQQNYEIQQSALELANRRVAGELANLEAGRAEVRNLVEAQDAQIAAQNAVTAALVDYQVARLQLMLDIGILKTEQPKFWLADHLAGVPHRPAEAPGAGEELIAPDQFFNQ